MRTSRLILALAAIAATTLGCAQSAGVNNPGYGGAGGTSATGGTGNGGSTGGNGGSTGGNGGSTGGTGAGGSTGGTGAGGSTGGTGAGGSTGGTGAGGSGGGTCTPPVAGGACDTSPQCGCNAGQACEVVDVSGKTGCVAAGSVGAYQICDSSNTCQAGYTCVGSTVSACKPYCDSVADCPGTGRECLQLQYDNNGTPTPIPGAKICSSGCDPTNPGAICASGMTCVPTQSNAATACVAAGTGTGAGACTQADPTCAPGYLCVGDSGGTNLRCAQFCKVGDPTACSGCADLNTPIVIGTTHYGICP